MTLYRWVNEFLLRSKERNSAFARCFSIICWNLMCRSDNAVGIRVGHMEWRNDSLVIYFAHMKNDQNGDKAHTARHIFANPVHPEICPILALGIHLLCTEGIFSNGEQSMLFQGKNQSQSDRFRRIMQRQAFCTEEGRRVMQRHGLIPDDIGTHSWRKGATTYATSGTTASPSIVAVHLRGGWAMDGVLSRYMGYGPTSTDLYVFELCCAPHAMANLLLYFITDSPQIRSSWRPTYRPSLVRTSRRRSQVLDSAAIF